MFWQNNWRITITKTNHKFSTFKIDVLHLFKNPEQCPLQISRTLSKQKEFQVFKDALKDTMKNGRDKEVG